MPGGVVKKWFGKKGYGFIAPDDGGEDVFVHAKCLDSVDHLIEGTAVTFETQWDDSKCKYSCSTCSKSDDNSSGIKKNRLDLHGLFVPDAKESTTKFLEQCITNFEELEKEGCVKNGIALLEIVYGAGNHSLDGNPLIKPAVCELVSSMGLKMEMIDTYNQGAMHVMLPRPQAKDKAMRKSELADPQSVRQLNMREAKGRQNIDLVFSGRLGIMLDFTSGHVTNVDVGGQADAKGVKEGWAIVEVNGNMYSKENLKVAVGPGVEYTLTFAVKASRPDVELPGQSEMKTVLKKLQRCASDEFLLRFRLKGRGSQKTVDEMNYSAFKEIFVQFNLLASTSELEKYNSM